MSRTDNSSTRPSSAASNFKCTEINVEITDKVGKPRVGLGSTANENIALRRNYREMEMLWKAQKILGDEQVYMLKLIDLYEKSVQLNYKRLTKRVSRIHSHLTEEEIIEMENDLRKKEFANKYRMLLHTEHSSETPSESSKADGKSFCQNDDNVFQRKADGVCSMEVIKEEDQSENANVSNTVSRKLDNETCESKKIMQQTLEEPSERKMSSTKPTRSQTCQPQRTRCNSNSVHNKQRPETSPGFEKEESSVMNDIIPSLDGLLDQLHNIKPQQFYENQRKLKLYDIRLLGEELEVKKKNFYKTIDKIINWDKKEEKEVEDKKEEQPRQRKTSFMRSVLRNFSMELMMKTRQYGWTDLGQCRYLRNRGGDEEGDGPGVNTLAKDTMKINMDSIPPGQSELSQSDTKAKRIEPGFDANGKMIRTADLLGLK